MVQEVVFLSFVMNLNGRKRSSNLFIVKQMMRNCSRLWSGSAVLCPLNFDELFNY